MKAMFILGAVLVLCLAVSVILRPPAGGFDGRALLALVISALMVLSVPAVAR